MYEIVNIYNNTTADPDRILAFVKLITFDVIYILIICKSNETIPKVMCTENDAIHITTVPVNIG